MNKNELIAKIKAEIEKRIEFHSNAIKSHAGLNVMSLTHAGGLKENEYLLSLLSTLEPEKPVPNDLEKAADKYAEKHGFRVPYDGSDNFYDNVDVKASKEGFITGAKWQKEQMMKEAEPAEIGYFNHRGLFILTEKSIERMPVSEGDKVRVIIVKED